MHKDLAVLRQQLGTSYDDMARCLRLDTEDRLDYSGNTLRRWFRDDQVPIEVFFLLCDISGIGADRAAEAAFRLYPWAAKVFVAAPPKKKQRRVEPT